MAKSDSALWVDIQIAALAIFPSSPGSSTSLKYFYCHLEPSAVFTHVVGVGKTSKISNGREYFQKKKKQNGLIRH